MTEQKTNTFVIINKEGVTSEIYLAKLVRKVRTLNFIIIYSHIGVQWMADRVVNDFLGVGGWVKEYEKKTITSVENKESGKKYEQEVFEYYLKRNVHNQLEEQ